MADPSLYEPMPSVVARSDLLDLTPHGIVTSEAPRSQISASEIEQPYREMAGALDKWASATNEVGDYFAERQAQTDLAKQRVTRDANGNIQVLNPANSVFFGDAGFKYANAVRVGTAMQAANQISQQMTDLHVRNPLDPQAFQKSSDAFLDKFSQQYGSSPWAGPAIQHGRQLQTEHLDQITNRAATNDIELRKKDILANIQDQTNTMRSLARQGGTDTNEFKQARDKYISGEQSLVANPQFGYSKGESELAIKQTNALMRSEALIAHVDETYNKRGKAEAQKILTDQILNNKDLSEKDSKLLYSEGMSRLGFLTADEKAGFEADKQAIGYARKALARGDISSDGPQIRELYNTFQKNHSTEAIAELDRIIKVYPHVQATRQTPDSERYQAAPGTPAQPAAGGETWRETMRQNQLANKNYHWDSDTTSSVPDNAKYPGMPKGWEPPAASAPAPSASAGGFDLASYKARTNQIEGSGVSSAGAEGKYQFIPATAAAYAKYGDRESMMDHLTADNRAILKEGLGRDATPAETYLAHQQGAQGALHLMAEPSRRAGDVVGDAAIRNNGGNPDAPAGDFVAMWKAKFDRTPVPPGGAAVSANGRPVFTAQDYAADPGLIYEEMRALAEDPEDRASHYSATVDAMEKTVAGGNLAPTDDLAGVLQAAKNAPPGSALSLLGARAEGIMLAQMAMAGPGGGPMPAPQRQAFEQQIEAKINGSDLYHQKLAETALQLLREQDQHARDAPLTSGAQRFGLPMPPPIDAGHPEDVASAIAARGVLAQHIGALNQSEAPPILEKGDAQKLQGALMGQQGAQVIQSIMSSTRPEDLQRLTDEPAFRESVLAMARSTDPAKLNAGNSALDTLAKLNPRDFESKFGKEAITQLAYWQNNLAFKNPDEQAKAMQKANDPDQAAARAELTKVADKALEAVSPDNVVSKFSNGGFSNIFGLTGAGWGGSALPPQGAAGDVDAKQQLWVDYRNLYREAFAQTGDAKTADSAAMSRLSVKYGVSQLNGGRVTAYPPENYYPDVNGSKAWMAKQLDDEVAKAIGYTPPGLTTTTQSGGASFAAPQTDEQRAIAREFAAPRALLADTQTQRDLAAGRPPSYQVIIQGQNGFTALPDAHGQPRRFFFEPPYADQIERMEQMRAGRIPAAPFRSGGFQLPLQLPGAVEPAPAGADVTAAPLRNPVMPIVPQ